MDARFDVLIAGGGTGGCAAALAAARSGLRVLMTEETAWIGGQFTSQGVPPDEHGWIEEFGCTASYRSLREGIRAYYRRRYPLLDRCRTSPRLNPGNGWVSPLCHEPRVSLAVLEAMMAAHVASERLCIWRNAAVESLDVDGDRVRAAVIRHQDGTSTVEAKFFLDATELGDLLPMARCEHDSGTPGRRDNNQAFSWCFAIEHHEGENHTISRPDRYSYWRDYMPRLQPPWPGKLLSWTTPHPRTMEPNHYRFDPHQESPKAFSGLWSYRRLRDRSLYSPGFFGSDVSLVNWPLIDYLDGDLITASPSDRDRFLRESRELSLCVFYWMQTEAPRPDGGAGYPGLKPAADIFGTPDGFALAPYIRESRRIRALKAIEEREISAEYRPAETLAAACSDSLGIGYYRIDLHPTCGGDNYVDVPALPFQIPLRALVPVRMRNFLPAAKNIGTTHVTNGCYRLHPVEWNIGESAGLLAAWCIARRVPPQDVAEDNPEDFQSLLEREGIELVWPPNLDLAEGDAHRHAR